MKTQKETLIKNIRTWIILFMTGLILSGITAFPLETEVEQLIKLTPYMPKAIGIFIEQVYEALHQINMHYPFLVYGTDWLAFAHIVIAIVFTGPYKDPVKNIWVIEFGMISCMLVFPLALICGTIRHIPLYWQLIDCSFGVFGIIPLLYIHKKIKQLEDLH